MTATDLDTRWLHHLSAPNLTVIRHDLLKDDFPEGSFDLIHARAVFEHIADREKALARVIRWLAPGGWLAIEDVTRFPLDAATHLEYATALRACMQTLGRTGSDFAWARTFPAPLARHGLERVGALAQLDLIRGGSALAEFWSLGIDSLSTRAIELRLAPPDLLRRARRSLADPDFWDLSPAVFAAWGRRSFGGHPANSRATKDQGGHQ